MSAIAWMYIAAGLLMLIAVAVPSRSLPVTRVGGAIFGIGALAVGTARLQAPDSKLEYIGSIVLVIGAVIYVIGTLRDRARRKR